MNSTAVKLFVTLGITATMSACVAPSGEGGEGGEGGEQGVNSQPQSTLFYAESGESGEGEDYEYSA